MSCKMIKLSLDDIKEDLKNANPDDVVFNKNIFSKLTGKGTATKNEVSKEDNCYNDVLQFLHGEEELRNLIGELKIKQEDLADMKEQLQEWMVKLSGESTDENKMKTSAEVVEDEIVPEHESKEDNEDVIIESIEDELEEVSTDEFDANEGVINAVSLSENNTLDDSSSDSSDDLQDAPSSITQALLDESTDSNENEGDDNWEVEDDDLVIDDSSNDSD